MLPLVLALFAGIVYGRLIIEKDAVYDITDDYWFNYWFEDDLWAIDRRISYHNTHITQKCIKYEGNNKLCLCKYPNNNDLYYCHGRSVKSKQHHIAAKNAYKNFIMFYDEFDPYGRFPMSFNLDKGKDDNIVAEMGKGNALDGQKNLVERIKKEFAIMWCFAKKYKGNDFETAKDTYEDKRNQAIIAAETALAVYKQAAQNLKQEKNEYIRTNKIKEKDNKLEMILEKDKTLDWKTKKGAVIKLVHEHTKKVKERVDKIAAARAEYKRTIAPLLKPGFDEFNKRYASDTVTNAERSKINLDKWKLSKTEITFLVVYVMEDAIASATRAYWRQNMNDRYPTLRDLVYGVTHLPVKKNFFKSITTQLSDTNDYLVLWFGMRDINYPVHGKSIGQAFDHGVTFLGLWSTSMDKSVAEQYAGCPPNIVRADGVVFKIKVPKANVGEINGIDVRWVSTEKKEDHGEILIYDIPGEYVYVWKRCYFDQSTWSERQDPPGNVLIPIEAHGD